ncbi:hypothetical protein LJK88_09560 [Paenibacillus sp. P26]|nr:hypothetical protein LJK88_09560 [Paenibacillus sp. P26]UUZ89881.1 hypothetical protein LJK87_28060 [Paenibacillus sp. P25]
MSLVIFSSITWFLLGLFFVLPGKINRLDNALLFMTVILLNCNGSWIFIEEMKTIELAKPLPDYFAFLLFRTTVIPLLVVICHNLLLSALPAGWKTGWIVLAYGLLLLMEWLAVRYKIYTYIHWHLYYSMLYYLGLQILVFLFYKGFSHITAQED